MIVSIEFNLSTFYIISGYISMSNNKLVIIDSLYFVNNEGIFNLISLLGNKISIGLPDPIVLPIS